MLARILYDKGSALSAPKTSFSQHNKGATMTIFALAIVPLLLTIGLAIDFSRTNRGKAAVTETLDAGLLFVAKEYASDATIDVDQRLKDFFAKAFNPNEVKNLVVNAVVGNDNDFTGTASGEVPTTFMSIGSVKTVKFNIIAKVSMPKMEVALVLDNTGSMNEDAADGGTKIDALKQASHDLMDELMGAGPSENMKVGIVPYARYVNVGTDKAGEDWLATPVAGWNGCVGSRNAPLDRSDESYGDQVPTVAAGCPVQVQDLTVDKAVLLSSIDSMSSDSWTDWEDAYTYIPAGLSWGWRLLSHKAPFATASGGASSVSKAIVLMTDGANTVKATYPQHVVNCSGGVCDSNPADMVTREMCDNIKAQGITIYSVAFQAPTGGKAVMEYCASSSSNFYDATDKVALKAAFKNIAKALLRLRVTG